MCNTNEMQEGMLSFKNNQIIFKTNDNIEHLITEEHYVEIFQQYNAECSTYISLNQQYADEIWYFDIIDFNYKDEIPARFRIAKAGERVKTGTLRIEKNKLYLDLWDETVLQLERNTKIEIQLSDEFSRMRWQRVRIDYNETSKKWVFFNIFVKEYVLQDKHINQYRELEYNQLARITY